jgi:hypothetical protein
MADTTPPADAAEQQDANEWADALEDFAPGYDKEESKDDKLDTTTPETTTETSTADEAATKDKKPDAEQKSGDDTEKKTGDDKKTGDEKDDEDVTIEPPDSSIRNARQTAREAAKEVEDVAKDIRTKMFAEVPSELRDADGDPITSIEDVTKLINPRTGEAFTSAEATEWLISAQQQFNQRLATIDKQVEQIAEINVDLKDQADSINYQYGELLKSMPELRDQLWVEFEKTLVRDPNTDIITAMPVSLEKFYDMTLQPYVRLAESLEAQQVAQTTAQKAEADAKRVRTRADRSDIFGRGKVDDMDAEEKEWASAAQDYYGTK